MTAPSIETVQGWQGRTLVDADGDKVGKISDIYLDNDTGQPEWALVDTGLFGAKSTFVPIVEAQADGDSVQVPYAKSQIQGAPGVEPDGELSETEEDKLYRHYGMRGTGTDARADTGAPADTTGQGFGAPDADAERAEGAVGRDTSGPTTDNAMTRSEEELNVGTRTHERGRARLRKYIVTENVTTTVPVQREEARLEREPITHANADAAMAGGDITEEEHEVTLHEEEAVVSKRAVPKERVRLDTDTVTEQAPVTERVRKEVIETDAPETGKGHPNS
jgi:uncharacterized protein (TIGR02271 family)